MFRSPIFFILVISFVCFSCKRESYQKNNNKNDNNHKRDTIALNKAESFYQKQIFDSAFLYYNKYKIKAEACKDTADITYSIVQMARIQQIFGDYFGAESILIEALPIIKKEKTYKSAVNNLLGISAKELENFSEAIKYYNEAKKHSEDTLTLLTIDNNIAVVLTKQKKYSVAIRILQNVLKSDSINEPKYKTRKARILDNLGFVYFKKGENDKGLLMTNQALQIRLKEKDSYGSIESYLHLTEENIESNPKTAKKFAKNAYVEATINNSIDERLKALLFLIKIDPEKEYVLKYAFLKDSITQVRNTAKNQFAKIRYDATVANEENLKLKNENITTDLQLQKSQNEKNLWISASALLISLLFILYNYLKNKNKLEKQKATYFTETKIAKKIHDEIANDVFQTISFVETKKMEEPENKETLINLLDNLYQRSRNISKENESIETGESFIENLIEMISSYKSTTQNIIIKKDETINWMNLSEIKKITLYRVLQELLVNMKKHSEAGIVVLNFANTKNDITIDYSDNGKGLEIDSIKKSGISNVENRIQNINGKITFDATSNGLKIKINIPK